MDNSNDSEDDLQADNESKIELDNGIRDSATQEQRDVSAAQNVPGLSLPTRTSKKMDEQVLMMGSTMETRSNWGIRKE